MTFVDLPPFAVDPGGLFTPLSTDALAADLRALLKPPDVHRRVERVIGPTLRALCGITRSDDTTAAVHAVTAWLEPRVAALPPQLRVAARSAFGLDTAHTAAVTSVGQSRIVQVADILDISTRTAYRRVGDAIDAIARATTPGDGLLAGLRRHTDTWVDLTIAVPTPGGPVDVTDRCLLLATPHDLAEPDKLYAVIRLAQHPSKTTYAIPTVWIRRVHPASTTRKPAK